MQVQKDHTQEQILKAARDAFLTHGFSKTTMRDVAHGAGVGLSNIYNYFENKEAIFRTLVQPLIDELNHLANAHHDLQYADQFIDYLQGKGDDMLKSQTDDYLHLVRCYRDEMLLLFFKAQGSSYETFLDDFTDSCTQQVIVFMKRFEEQHPNYSLSCSPFTYHLHTVWMFNLLCEVIKHDLNMTETEQVVRDFLRFEYIGWRDLINR
jgi:AcrR family transcriptional regulator